MDIVDRLHNEIALNAPTAQTMLEAARVILAHRANTNLGVTQMSDGTTGIQVAPIPTESEMASIRQIFTNVANALVRASELAKTVTELETKFSSLNEDHTRVMARSDQLEQSLSEARMQRDEAQSNLVQVKAERDAANAEATANANGWSEAKTEVDNLNAKLETVGIDRDAAYKAWQEVDARAAKAEATLNELKAKMETFFSKPAEPTASPEPIPEPRPLTEAEVHPPQADDPNLPKAEPEQAFTPYVPF